MHDIDAILDAQRRYFAGGTTFSAEFRLQMLKRLKEAIKKYEADIERALTEDLGKSPYESYMTEVGIALEELSYMIGHLRRLMAKKHVPTPLMHFASSSYTVPVPHGNVLIISPWNYPFQLTMVPLTDAIAAGNTALIKPSAYSPATSRIVGKIISECFPPEYVAVVSGGRRENAALLERKFDFVFFTGSQAVGKEVLRHCAETLTPSVLELGGKSPCIVDRTAKLELAARRIVFGKFLNCGQTCVAPDYILCESSVKDRLIEALIREIKAQYGEDPLQNPNYGRIVNQKHFDRLRGLMDEKKQVYGGRTDPGTLRIAPTVMDGVTWDDPVMGEEIFGPLLPILSFESFDELPGLLRGRPKPLALYLFSQDQAHIRRVTEQLAYGGGCINDTIIHIVTSSMGFGGVGESGMGAYHGKKGFETFSHTKSIVDKKTWLDLPMRYQPYQRSYEKLLRLFLK